MATPYKAPPHYAGFWIRVVGAFIDFLAVFIVLFPVRILTGSIVTVVSINSEMSAHQTFLLSRAVRIAIAVLLSFAYRAGMESSTFQATLGKLAMRLKVTDLEGRRLTFARACTRFFAKWLSLITLGLGYAMAGFDEEKQALHDRVAGTLVLYRQRFAVTRAAYHK
jgi:uncharacterized RDD family membrane protein YckC